MNRNGKIALLPEAIRDQLNRRIANRDRTRLILAWLNSLPEVQAVLAEKSRGAPVTQQNFSQWHRGGFRDWKIRRHALDWVARFDLDDSNLQQLLTGNLTQKLVCWIALRYAAAANTVSDTGDPDPDPQAEFRQLREFCQDIVTLRRGDLSAGRLDLATRRLNLQKASTILDSQTEVLSAPKHSESPAIFDSHCGPNQHHDNLGSLLNHLLLGLGDPSTPAHDPNRDLAANI